MVLHLKQSRFQCIFFLYGPMANLLFKKTQINHIFRAWKTYIRKTGNHSQLSFNVMRNITCPFALRWENIFYYIFYNCGITETSKSIWLFAIPKLYLYFYIEDTGWGIPQWGKCLFLYKHEAMSSISQHHIKSWADLFVLATPALEEGARKS